MATFKGNTQQTLRGTELAMQVIFSYPADPAITLDSIDWYTEWYCGDYNPKKALRLTKGQCHRHVQTDEGVETVIWMALVDTTGFYPGKLCMRLMAYIPDPDASEGVREEYAETTTEVTLK